MLRLLLFIFISLTLLPNPAFSKGEKKKLKIGLLLRLAETYDPTPIAIQEGVKAAKQIFEKKYPEFNIEISEYKHGNDFNSVILASRQIVKDHPIAVIGGEKSSHTIVIGDEFQATKMILVTPTSSNPQIVNNKPYIFSMCAADDTTVLKLVDLVEKEIKPKNLGVIWNVSSVYSSSLAKIFTDTFNKKAIADLKLHIFKVIDDTPDFEGIISEMKKARVSHVAMLTYENDLIRFFSQAEKSNFFPTYIGTDGWGSNEYVYETLVKKGKNGDKFSGIDYSYWHETASPLNTLFFAEYKKLFNKKPNSESAIAFDSAWTLFNAVRKTKNPTNTDQLKASLEELKIPLVTAPSFQFDSRHFGVRSFYFYKIDSSGINLFKTIP